MEGRYSGGIAAHLDNDPSIESRLVFHERSGEFREPPKQTQLYIKMLPVPWLTRAAPLTPSALWVGLACWFMDGCNRQKPFTLTKATCRRFDIKKWDKRRGLKQLENAGLIKISRRPGRLSMIEMVREVGSPEAANTDVMS